jgi:hypothetical protein
MSTATITELTVGDIIRYKHVDTEGIYVVKRVTAGTVSLISHPDGQSFKSSFKHIARVSEMIYDNNGELSVEEAMHLVGNSVRMQKTQLDSLTKLVNTVINERFNVKDDDPLEAKQLSDILKPGDFIYHRGKVGSSNQNGKVDYVYEVISIDPLSQNMVNKVVKGNHSVGNSYSCTFVKLNAEYAQTTFTAPIPRKKWPTLTVHTQHSEEIYRAHYESTWRDRRYIKYCMRMDRDIPKNDVKEHRHNQNLDIDSMVYWFNKVMDETEIKELITKLNEKLKSSN